jgi:phage gpG-like protein
MAGVSLTMDVRHLKEALRRAAAATRNLRPAMRDIGEHMLRSVNRNFDVQGRPQKWAPLAASTLARVALGSSSRRKTRRTRFTRSGSMRAAARRRLSGKKILIDTGRLIRSITYRAMTREVVIGTNVKYAATHQFGRGKIPARPFLLVHDEDRREAASILLRHIAGEFR